MQTQKIIQQGAEAVIILKNATSLERSVGNSRETSNKFIIKRRLKKSYRIPELDEKIRKQRTRSEGKLLEKASKVINIPEIIKVDEKTKEIFMQFIPGKKLSEHLDSFTLKKQKEICKEIGKDISKLHDADIIHGDLTTSNMILSESNFEPSPSQAGGREHSEQDTSKSPKVFFIDFGLGYISKKIEDRAVDLHLLKQALEARHFKNWKTLFAEVQKGYSKLENSKKVLEQLKKVETRGRYKDKY